MLTQKRFAFVMALVLAAAVLLPAGARVSAQQAGSSQQPQPQQTPTPRTQRDEAIDDDDVERVETDLTNDDFGI